MSTWDASTPAAAGGARLPGEAFYTSPQQPSLHSDKPMSHGARYPEFGAQNGTPSTPVAAHQNTAENAVGAAGLNAPARHVSTGAYGAGALGGINSSRRLAFSPSTDWAPDNATTAAAPTGAASTAAQAAMWFDPLGAGSHDVSQAADDGPRHDGPHFGNEGGYQSQGPQATFRQQGTQAQRRYSSPDMTMMNHDASAAGTPMQPPRGMGQPHGPMQPAPTPSRPPGHELLNQQTTPDGQTRPGQPFDWDASYGLELSPHPSSVQAQGARPLRQDSSGAQQLHRGRMMFATTPTTPTASRGAESWVHSGLATEPGPVSSSSMAAFASGPHGQGQQQSREWHQQGQQAQRGFARPAGSNPSTLPPSRAVANGTGAASTVAASVAGVDEDQARQALQADLRLLSYDELPVWDLSLSRLTSLAAAMLHSAVADLGLEYAQAASFAAAVMESHSNLPYHNIRTALLAAHLVWRLLRQPAIKQCLGPLDAAAALIAALCAHINHPGVSNRQLMQQPGHPLVCRYAAAAAAATSCASLPGALGSASLGASVLGTTSGGILECHHCAVTASLLHSHGMLSQLDARDAAQLQHRVSALICSASPAHHFEVVHAGMAAAEQARSAVLAAGWGSGHSYRARGGTSDEPNGSRTGPVAEALGPMLVRLSRLCHCLLPWEQARRLALLKSQEAGGESPASAPVTGQVAPSRGQLDMATVAASELAAIDTLAAPLVQVLAWLMGPGPVPLLQALQASLARNRSLWVTLRDDASAAQNTHSDNGHEAHAAVADMFLACFS